MTRLNTMNGVLAEGGENEKTRKINRYKGWPVDMNTHYQDHAEERDKIKDIYDKFEDNEWRVGSRWRVSEQRK